MPADGSWTPAYWHPSAWCSRAGNQTPDLVVTGEAWLRQDCQQVAEAVGLVLGKESQPLAPTPGGPPARRLQDLFHQACTSSP